MKKIELVGANWRELECQKVSAKIKGRRKIGEVYSISFLDRFWGQRWIFRPLHGGNEVTLYKTFETGIEGVQKAREHIVEQYQVIKAE